MFDTLKRKIAKVTLNAVGKDAVSDAIREVNLNRTNPPKVGTRQLLDLYNRLPWFRGVVGKISTSTASQQWQLFKETDTNAKRFKSIQTLSHENRNKLINKGVQDNTLERVLKHPILDILNGGNDVLIGNSNLQVAQVQLDTNGECFLYKARNNVGLTTSLWPMPPNWIMDTPHNEDGVYMMSHQVLQESIPAQDVIWIKNPDPVEPYRRGSGIGRTMVDELQTDEFTAQFTKQWFYNSAKPDLLVYGEGIDKDSTKRLEQDWLNKNQGFLKRFKPYFVKGDIKVTQLNNNFRDMQLIELREFERDLIIQVFGVPPEILGILESSNRATIEEADFIYAKYVLVPRLELQRQAFQMLLVAEFSDSLILNYENPIQEDKEHKLKVFSAAPWAFKVDEWRKLGTEPPLENDEGDQRLLPFNLVEQNTTTQDNSDLEKQIASLTKTVGDLAKQIVNQPKQLEKPRKQLDPDDLLLINNVVAAMDTEIMVESLLPVIRNTVESFGSTVNLGITGDENTFFIADPRITEFISNNSATRIRSLVDNTTRKQIQKALNDGLSLGETIPQLTTRINKIFDNADSNRSASIARTETVRASNFGSQEGMLQAGVPRKQWLSSRDSAVRESHAIGSGLDTQTVDIKANFKSPTTGAEGPHPGDLGLASEDVNCRCTVLPIFEDEDVRSNFTEETKVKIWKAFEDQRRPFEKVARREIKKAFGVQEKSVLDELNKFA